jgi:hypothetical protein
MHIVCVEGVGIKGAPESAATYSFQKFIGLGVLIGLTAEKCKCCQAVYYKRGMSAGI